MSKDPAVLFYTSDFLTKTAFLSFEERGQYITLLCYQHQNGHIPERFMLQILGTKENPVWEKYDQDEKGLWYQERMDTEAMRRQKFSESRRNNALGAHEEAHADTSEEAYAQTYADAMQGHMETETETETITTAATDTPKTKGLPEKFNTPKFIEALTDFRQHRKEKKKPLTQLAERKLLKTLSDFDVGTAIRMIDKSIESGWTGVFPLDSKKKVELVDTLDNDPEYQEFLRKQA